MEVGSEKENLDWLIMKQYACHSRAVPVPAKVWDGTYGACEIIRGRENANDADLHWWRGANR